MIQDVIHQVMFPNFDFYRIKLKSWRRGLLNFTNHWRKYKNTIFIIFIFHPFLVKLLKFLHLYTIQKQCGNFILFSNSIWFCFNQLRYEAWAGWGLTTIKFIIVISIIHVISSHSWTSSGSLTAVSSLAFISF